MATSRWYYDGTITTPLSAPARTPWRVLMPHTHMHPFKSPPSQAPGSHYNSPQVTMRESTQWRPVRRTDLRRATHQGKARGGGGGGEEPLDTPEGWEIVVNKRE